VTNPLRYDEQIRQEAGHWGAVRRDAHHAQLWHDPFLNELFFGRELAMFRQAAVKYGPDILELGCGEGTMAVTLALAGLHVTGLDLSPERIQRAQQLAVRSRATERAVFQVADLNTESLATNAYSCILAHDSLHHILNLDRLVDQVWDALRDGGRFIVMDYQGMGRLRKFLAAAATAVLPTTIPYREKWGYRKRFRAFMAGEAEKRQALESGDQTALHPDSPFEEISQESIIPRIGRRFRIEHVHSYLPFWFYLAPKLRTPKSLRAPCARWMRLMDSLGSLLGIQGAYFYLEAVKG